MEILACDFRPKEPMTLAVFPKRGLISADTLTDSSGPSFTSKANEMFCKFYQLVF